MQIDDVIGVACFWACSVRFSSVGFLCREVVDAGADCGARNPFSMPCRCVLRALKACPIRGIKRPGGHTGLETRCPYHSDGPNSTVCTKTHKYGEGIEGLAARQMKQWCLQGRHRRQRRVDDGRLIVGGHLHHGLEVNPDRTLRSMLLSQMRCVRRAGLYLMRPHERNSIHAGR